jgi:hypothetical protein
MSAIVSTDVCHGVGGAFDGGDVVLNDARKELGSFSRPWAPFVRCAPTAIV